MTPFRLFEYGAALAGDALLFACACYALFLAAALLRGSLRRAGQNREQHREQP